MNILIVVAILFAPLWLYAIIRSVMTAIYDARIENLKKLTILNKEFLKEK
jgi:hypothetical protein